MLSKDSLAHNCHIENKVSQMVHCSTAEMLAQAVFDDRHAALLN